MTTTRAVHPAAGLLPSPSAEDLNRLTEDIKLHGQRVPIVVTQDGAVLDGRSRLQVCQVLGITPKTREATASEMLEPVAFVLSLNAARRHLTGDQVIAIYLRANEEKLNAEKQAAKIAQQAGLKKGSTQPARAAVNPTGKTAAKIAKAVGKSESAVKRVQRVQRDAPDKLADVAAGKVSAAKVIEEQNGHKVSPAVRVNAESRAADTLSVSLNILVHQVEAIEKRAAHITDAQAKVIDNCRISLGAVLVARENRKKEVEVGI